MSDASKLFALVIIIHASILLVPGSFGSESRRIRVFCFGDVIEQYGGRNSYAVIETDPAIDTTLVPTRPGYVGSSESAKRFLRIYMPRTYDSLVRNYDLILSSDADKTVFRSDWINWFSDSVLYEGMDYLWLGSIGRSLGSSHPLSWTETTVAEILPASTDTDRGYKYGSFRLRISDEDEELMKALPWESSPPLANLDMQIPKEGSEVWAVMEEPTESIDWPLMTFWELNEGSVLCFASKFPNGVMPWSNDWPIFSQAMIYLAYRTSGRRLPEEHLLFQNMMSIFTEYQRTDSILISTLAFVEGFGGNMKTLYHRMDQLSGIKAQANEAYLGEDYEKCLQLMEEARTEQDRILDESVKAKDNALLWIYVTEWCVVTAAFLISGTVLWSMMVKKKLYVKVRSSRLSSRQERK